MVRLLSILGLVVCLASTVWAADTDSTGEPQSSGQAPPLTATPLWDGPAPLAKGETPADIPRITQHAPSGKPNGAAIIVCPGGGYGGLMTTYEGGEVADWFTGLGVTAFVLEYRVAPYQHPAPLADVQRAIRTVRSRAESLGIDPQKIGVIGFSAGGHLAATAATHFSDTPVPEVDEIDKLSARPDFAILVYPVISLQPGVTHAGSLRNLLGEKPTPELVDSLSAELAVTKETPPTFLFHTAADTVVLAEHSIRYFQACQKAGVPSELHIFEQGPHGVGLGQKDSALKVWPTLCVNWLRRHEFLPANE